MATERYLLDVNVLIALAWPQHVHHARAHSWFGSLAGRRWATTPFTEAAFIRLSTNPAVVGVEMGAAGVLSALAVIRALPGHDFLPDDASLASPRIALTRLASHRDVTDLHLANLATASGWRLATLDALLPDLLDPADREVVVVLPD